MQALADMGGFISILSYNLAVRLSLQVRKPVNAMLSDASGNPRDVSVRGSLTVQEEHVWPYDIRVIISKSPGKEELVVRLEDLKSIYVLHVHRDIGKPY